MAEKKLKIPAKHLETLTSFFKLEFKIKDKIVIGFESEDLKGSGTSKTLEFLGSSIGIIEGFDLDAFVDVVFNLLRAKSAFNNDESRFIVEVVKQFEVSGYVLNDDDLSLLNRILKSSVAITVKAIELSLEVGNAFLDSRIITDLRPLFTTEKDVDLIGNVIIHSLKIQFRNASSNNDSMFFTMDNSDLKNLKKAIERALLKEEVLREKLKDQNILDLKF